MTYSGGQGSFKLAFECAPIALTGGIASSIPGGVVSILSLFANGGLLGSLDDLDQAFANFFPVSGGELFSNLYGNYPFANMKVAANAGIRQPLNMSMLMRVPVKDQGWSNKAQIMTALKNTLEQHTLAGGTFSVATPSFFYTDMLLIKLHDVSGGETLQPQYQYQWDFWKPLVTVQEAQATQNAMMSLLSSGAASDGSLSGTAGTLGQPGTGASAVVSSTSAAASNVVNASASGGIGRA